MLGASRETDRDRDAADGGHLRRGGTADDALRHADCIRAVARAHDHAELFSAETTDDVLRADGGAQRVGELLQHLVADAVAVNVVDPLEVVDVEHEYRHRPVRTARLLQRSEQPLVEGAVVEEAGERIGLRLMLEPRADLRVVEGERRRIRETLCEIEFRLVEHSLFADAIDVEDALDLGAGDERNRDQRLGIDRRPRHDADPRIEMRLVRRGPPRDAVRPSLSRPRRSRYATA